VLLFAWESTDTPYVFEFGTLEELLGGIRTCPDYPSQLLLYGESYILFIFTTGSDEPLRYLYEFGEPRNASEAFLAHIEEQGKVLAASDAVKTLKTLLSC
jgi:negative regulator of genetic competence, sporulation and motility